MRKVWVCQQKLGDLVIVPRMSYYQVVNHGGLSIKVSWSRLPLSSIEPAILHELPIYRRCVIITECFSRVCSHFLASNISVGRPEGYRVKLLIHQTIDALSARFQHLVPHEVDHYRTLFRLMNEIHFEEYHRSHEQYLPEDNVIPELTCGKSLTFLRWCRDAT